MWHYVGTDYNNDYLTHHGILGQKWGVRRFQNPDGSLTPEGRQRYLKKYGMPFDNANELPKNKREAETMMKNATEAWSQAENRYYKMVEDFQAISAKSDSERKSKHAAMKKELDQVNKELSDLYNDLQHIKKSYSSINNVDSPEYRIKLRGIVETARAKMKLQKTLENFISEYEVNNDIPEKDWIKLH